MIGVDAEKIHEAPPEVAENAHRLAIGVRDTLVKNQDHITDADGFYDFLSWFMHYHRELPGGLQIIITMTSLYLGTRLKYPEMVAGREFMDAMLELVNETIEKVELFTSEPGGNA